MELQLAGTNIEITKEISNYAERKLGKITRHLPTIIESKVEISEEKTKSPQEHFLVRVTVDGGVGGAVFHGEERGEDVFKAIDKVAAVITRQLDRHKGKLYDKGRGNSLARSKYDETNQPVEPKKTVRKERFPLDTMSVDEAIERMEEMENSFYLFLDDADEAIKLLYRRNEDEYGIIEPEIP